MPYKNKEDKNAAARRWKRANREQLTQSQREYREANREAVNSNARDYYANNTEMFRLKKERQTKDRLDWLLENVGDSCAECGSTKEIEFDHINPALKTNRCSFRALGVETLKEQVDNIQTLCHDCHVKKSVAQKKAAWHLFCELSLEEQNELINQFL